MSAQEQPAAPTVLSARVGAGWQLTPLAALAGPVLSQLLEETTSCLEVQHQDLLLDLGRIQTLDSLALETLLEMQNAVASHGGRMRVSNANPLIVEIFHITGIEYRISITQPEAGDSMSSGGHKRLGDILIAQRMLTEDQVKGALSEQNESKHRLGEIFIEKGWLSEQDVLRALSAQLSIPSVKLRPGVSIRRLRT